MKNHGQTQPHGFDAPVKQRTEDHLKRWAFAREIYGIATTGPKDWSVRIGIYGEWGTGKTSVLEFISAIAKKAGDVVVRFNPWEHSSRDTLWRTFVLSFYKEPELSSVAGAWKARMKKRFGGIFRRAKVLESGTALWNERAGKGVRAGLDLVKSFFDFGPKDLNVLSEGLGNRRIIVLIDDLERTAPELVPEILFALKEIMSVARFAFVCAFDPVVVGEILGRYHPGYGDGLRFLEKIIDYPRWLPPATSEDLTRLALADVKNYCEFVPEQAVRDVLPLLPDNPRAIRQFIRLIALLNPQIQRHHEYELRWPVILTANALKIRYPRLAHPLLRDNGFWDSLWPNPLLAKDENEEKEQLNTRLEERIERTLKLTNIDISTDERDTILKIMRNLYSSIDPFRDGWEFLAYQMNIAEAPHAVTWKEFDELFDLWKKRAKKETVSSWIKQHGGKVDRSESEVYTETFAASLRWYRNALRQAAEVPTDAQAKEKIAEVESVFGLLECLLFEIGQPNQPDCRINAQQIDRLFDTFAAILREGLPQFRTFWKKNEKLLLKFIESWAGEAAPLVAAIQPYGHWESGRFDGQRTEALHKKLSQAVLPKFAEEAIHKLRQPNYVRTRWNEPPVSLQVRALFLTSDSPLWTRKRNELLAVLGEASSNQTVQENAYELLHLFDHLLREKKGTEAANNATQILSDDEIRNALWNAATAKQLSLTAVAHLRHFPDVIAKFGKKLKLPQWWQPTLGNLRVAVAALLAESAAPQSGKEE